MKLMISNPERDLLSKSNILFKIDGCVYCRFYDWFISSINQKLSPDKQFSVVNCTFYHDYNIVTDPRIPIFLKYYKGSYPALFVKGQLVPGANSLEELIAWIKVRMSEHFIVEEELLVEMEDKFVSLIFDKQCEFKKDGWFKNKVVCS